MSPIIPFWLRFCSCDGAWFLLDWYSWAHRWWFSWLGAEDPEYPAATMLQEDLFCLQFPFWFWVAQVSSVQLEQVCKCLNFRNQGRMSCPACRGMGRHIQAPAIFFYDLNYSFPRWQNLCWLHQSCVHIQGESESDQIQHRNYPW